MSNQSEADSPQSQVSPEPETITKAIDDATRGFRKEIEGLKDPVRQAHLSNVVDYLVEKRQPASTGRGRHGAFDGGLLVHCWMMFRVAGSVSALGLLPTISDLVLTYTEPVIPDASGTIATMSHVNHASMLTAILLHDLNKAVSINGEPYYVPKILTSGARSEKVPWEISDKIVSPIAALAETATPENSAWAKILAEFQDCVSLRDGISSLAAAERISPGILATLSNDEKHAIVYHDGAYAGRSGLQGKETGLQMVLHFADMIAARWLS